MSQGYLFDTDAIAQLGLPRPLRAYVEWLARIPPERQFICTPVLAECFAGAYSTLAMDGSERVMQRTERLAVEMSVISFGIPEARCFGNIRATLRSKGLGLADLDMQIASCAICNDLVMITGNRQHFERMEVFGLQCDWVLADALAAGQRRAGQN